MSKFFISHSSKDNVIAHSLASQLQTFGASVFLDFSHQFGILGGTNWEQSLLDALNKTDALMLCCTPNTLESKWCFAEVMIARFSKKPVFPLLFSGKSDDVWEFLRATVQIIDFTGDPDRGYQRLHSALKKSGLI